MTEKQETTPPPNIVYFTNRDDWRAWLQSNHATENDVWLTMYKKHTKQPCVSYSDAVEEALCFGWIDSAMKPLDADRHIQRFSPRKPKSNWSDSNKIRVRQLIASGRMTEAGLSKVTFPLDEADTV
jgi:uncharacterized protein YdeI (YjbR/CyaY-like superfamily)